MIESGRERFDVETQALNDLILLGKRHRAVDPEAPCHTYLPPEQRGISRLRKLGGTSNAWTGKSKHFQDSDFLSRDWVLHSARPIRLFNLMRHHRGAARDYGVDDLEAE